MVSERIARLVNFSTRGDDWLSGQHCRCSRGVLSPVECALSVVAHHDARIRVAKFATRASRTVSATNRDAAYDHFHAEVFGGEEVSCWGKYWTEREITRTAVTGRNTGDEGYDWLPEFVGRHIATSHREENTHTSLLLLPPASERLIKLHKRETLIELRVDQV